MGLGGIAAAELAGRESSSVLASDGSPGAPTSGALRRTHHAAKAKRVIYLFQSGGPSQLETWDYKPLLNEKQGEPLPDSVRQGQRLTGMSGNQAILPLAGSKFKFARHGQSGRWASELIPHMADQVDRIAVIKSMYTEAINHDPAITYFQTGNQIAGRPSIGAWINYGLGSANEDLPTFVVLVTKGKGGQPLYSRLWGSGFLPSRFQGVQFRGGKEPVLYLHNPPGVSAASRRNMLDRLQDLHNLEQSRTGDPELTTRIAQYEMAFRMQSSVPEVTDLSGEPEHIYDMYGSDVKKPGSFAANCLLARRLAEKGVRFIQLYHQGWDQHGGLPSGITRQCKETDQPAAALLKDLDQRGMLEGHARHLGRRVRQDELLPRKADRRQLRSRPSSTMLFDVDGGRRHPARCLLRRDLPVRIQHRRKRRSRSGLSRDATAPAGNRSREIHGEVPGVGRPTDRRRTGPCRQRSACMNRLINANADRREFLRNASAIAAASVASTSAPTRVRAQDDPAAEANAGGQIYKSLKWNMVKLPGSVRDKFAVLKRLGYDGVELDSPGGIDPAQAVRASDELELPVEGIVNSTHWRTRHSDPDPEVRRAAMADMREALRYAKAVGAESVLLVPGKVTDPEDENHDQVWQRSIAAIRQLAPLADDLGVQILIENVGNGFCESPELFGQYIDEIDHSSVGVHFDIGNHIRISPPAEWIGVLGHRIKKLDVKDRTKTGSKTLIGEGDADWPAVRAALADLEYRGWAAAEVTGGDRERLADVLVRMNRVLGRSDGNPASLSASK